jgi:hypothetical protein
VVVNDYIGDQSAVEGGRMTREQGCVSSAKAPVHYRISGQYWAYGLQLRNRDSLHIP